MGIVGRIASNWLTWQSKAIICNIDGGNRFRKSDVQISATMKTGHRHKIIIDHAGQKSICHLSLHSDFCRTLSQMHRLALEHDVPVANILDVGRSWIGLVPVYYLLLEWMPGVPCNKEIELDLTQLRHLGGIFGRLHSVGYNEGMSAQYKYLGNRSGHQKVESEIVDRFESLCLYHRIGPKDRGRRLALSNAIANCEIWRDQNLIHGDPHGNNIVINFGRFGLIDTDQMSYGFASTELFRCLLANYTNYGDRVRQQAFLSGYEAESDSKVWHLWMANLQIAAVVALLGLSYNNMLKGMRVTGETRRLRGRKTSLAYWKACLQILDRASEGPVDLDHIMDVITSSRKAA